MPVLPILDDAGRLLADNHAGIHVLATMLYPSDETARESYVAAILQDRMMSNEPEGDIPGNIARLTFEAGGRAGISKDALAKLSQGPMAGETLLCVLQLAEFHPEHASLRKARHIVKNFRLSRKFGAPLRIPTSTTRLETAWTKFKPVAHLWAGFIPWWKKAEGEDVFRDATLPDILADAKWFAAEGANFTPRHARQPLLSASEIWAIPDSPDIPDFKLEPPRISEKELR